MNQTASSGLPTGCKSSNIICWAHRNQLPMSFQWYDKHLPSFASREGEDTPLLRLTVVRLSWLFVFLAMAWSGLICCMIVPNFNHWHINILNHLEKDTISSDSDKELPRELTVQQSNRGDIIEHAGKPFWRSNCCWKVRKLNQSINQDTVRAE